MQSPFKLPTALLAVAALNACSPTQPAEVPQKATEIRTNVGDALAQIGTDKQGIQAGPDSEMLYSVVCGKGIIEDQTRTDVRIAAMRALMNYACADPETYVPTLAAGGGLFSDTVCERVMTPRTIVCNGQEIRLDEPR